MAMRIFGHSLSLNSDLSALGLVGRNLQSVFFIYRLRVGQELYLPLVLFTFCADADSAAECLSHQDPATGRSLDDSPGRAGLELFREVGASAVRNRPQSA